MARTGVSAAINARLTPQVEYGPDPRGWAWFRRLSGVQQGGISGRDGLRVVDPVVAFHGALTVPVQSMTGMAPLGLAAPLTADTSTLADERAAGPLDNAAQRIFAERLRRSR